MVTGLLYDERYLQHDPGAGHPERRERLIATMQYLKTQSWFASLAPIAPTMPDRRWIETIHSGAYIDRVAAEIKRGVPFVDTPDVAVSADSYSVALLATGGVLQVVDQVMTGSVENGFALIRPPGHHAEANTALGFCLFNNVAIAARYLQQQYGLDKVLILDWDVHHGNGTQHSFEEDASVLYVSLHQYPYYPGTGAHSETGSGRGAGATLNCPMPAGASDDEYRQAFVGKILPKIAEFKPDAVLISAGFDAHTSDPLAQIDLSTEFYRWMSERLMEVADQHSGGRLISMLEGGYSLDALPPCVGEHLLVLMGNPQRASNI